MPNDNNFSTDVFVRDLVSGTIERVSVDDDGNQGGGGFYGDLSSISADGRYVYVGNFLSRNVSILRVEGDTVVHTGKTIDLEAAPAAMRGSR